MESGLIINMKQIVTEVTPLRNQTMPILEKSSGFFHFILNDIYVFFYFDFSFLWASQGWGFSLQRHSPLYPSSTDAGV